MTSNLTAFLSKQPLSGSTDVKHREEHFDSQGFCICVCGFCIKLDGTCVCSDCPCRLAGQCQGENGRCNACKPNWTSTFSEKKA
jgi:hypothetical protein